MHIRQIALVVGVLAVATAVAGAANLESAMVYYTGPQGAGTQVNRLVAQRYGLGVTGLEIGRNATEIRGFNPDFEWFVYNSSTDNYVASEEDALLATIAARHGCDPEIGYLHYYDDTVVRLAGQTVTVRGWGGGSAVSPREARVPVYSADLSRRATHFSTPVARQIQEEVILALTVDRVFTGTTLRPDGIFLDNTAYQLYNTGEILSGGHVREAPGHALIGSAQFQIWHWNAGLGPFLTALDDTLQGSASWSPDHRRKWLMINIGDTWTDSYVTRDAADILFMEFQYDPVRNADPNAVLAAWQRDRAAAAVGIRSYYAPVMEQTCPPYHGSIGFGTALLGSLAWHLATRSDQSLLFLFGSANPAQAGWDTLTWRGCVDQVKDLLGPVSGDPYVYAEGTDGTGKAYRVWGRRYDNGLVLVRNRGRWDEDIEPATTVGVHLPGPAYPLLPSGEFGARVYAVRMRNGTGAVLLYNLGASDTLPAPVTLGFGFDPSTPTVLRGAGEIVYTLPRAGHVRLELFDVQGSRIANLADGYRGEGQHTVSAVPPGLPSGIYLLRLKWQGDALTRRLIILR